MLTITPPQEYLLFLFINDKESETLSIEIHLSQPTILMQYKSKTTKATFIVIRSLQTKVCVGIQRSWKASNELQICVSYVLIIYFLSEIKQSRTNNKTTILKITEVLCKAILKPLINFII